MGGEALRGPAAKFLEELGHEVSCAGVAEQYRGLCDIFVIDDVDCRHTAAIGDLGMRVELAPIVMADEDDKVRLARQVCRLLERSPQESRRS